MVMAASGNNQEHIYLRQTNVSQPRLEQASSQHSVNATEEFESARTSRPSSRASHDGLLHSSDNQFSTPPSSPPASPSRRPRPTVSQDTERTLQGQESGGTTPRQSMAVRDGQVKRKPVSSGFRERLDEYNYADGPPTPGADDSPYIRFAIDQLTRDEEVRGSRQYPAVAGGLGASRSSERLVPAAASGAAGTTTDDPVSSRETSGGGYPPAHIYDTYQPHAAQQDTPDQYETPPEERGTPDAQETIRAPPAAYTTQHGYPTRLDSRRPPVETSVPTLESAHDIFVPYDHEVPPLRFQPAILRLPWLGLYLFFCLWVLAGLLFSGIYPNDRDGLYAYTQFGGSRYFVFRYMPTFFGILMLLWLFQIQIALQRITPFISLASYNAKARSEAPLLSYLPSNFLIPQLQYFRASQPVVGAVMIVFWLQTITVPLLSSLYNVYNYGGGPNDWRWTAVQGVNWTLFALFALLAIAIITLIAWLPRQRTGLKWDTRSIADVIALLDRSNIMSDYVGSEHFTSMRQFRERLSDRSDRLGYWHTSRRPSETFHGIGEEGADTRRYSLDRGKIREKGPGPVEHSSFPPDTPDSPRGAWDSVNLESGEDYERVRHHYLPWYMRLSVALLWCTLGLLLYVAFLVVSFVNRAVIRGFAPLTEVAPTSAGFSAANFLYSFVPAVIAQILFLAWLSIDYAHRRLQPYVNMSAADGRGAPASRSLLVDYSARLPLSVTLDSLANKDYKVAWYTVITLIAASLPLLAGGCFWAQFYVSEQQVRVSVQTSGYYALCVFLALYAVTLPSVVVGLGKRRLPHGCSTLAEQISWLYQSNVLSERDRRGLLASKSELAGRVMGIKTQREQTILAGSEGHFLFGRFTGRDGKTHMGIERFGQGEKAAPRAVGVPDAFRQRDDSPRPGTSSRAATPQLPTRLNPGPQAQTSSAPLGSQVLATPTAGTPFVEKVFREMEYPGQQASEHGRTY